MASSISNRAIPMSGTRRRRSFARQRRSSLLIAAGIPLGSAVHSGSPFSTAAKTWEWDTVSPVKAQPLDALLEAIYKLSHRNRNRLLRILVTCCQTVPDSTW